MYQVVVLLYVVSQPILIIQVVIVIGNVKQIIIEIETSQIKYRLKDGRYLNMNLHEIRVGDNIIKQGLLEAFLFDCQCALFFVDMTKNNTLKPVKDIISKINFKKYPYLKIIIVGNKSDIAKKEAVLKLKNLLKIILI